LAPRSRLLTPGSQDGVSFRQHFLAACAHKLAARLRNGGGQQRLSQLATPSPSPTHCGLLRPVYAGAAGGCIKPINQRASAKSAKCEQTVVRHCLSQQRGSAYLINMVSRKHELILAPFKALRIFTNTTQRKKAFLI